MNRGIGVSGALAALSLAMICSVGASSAETARPRVLPDGEIMAKKDDPEMRAAEDKARRTLGEFIKAFDADIGDVDDPPEFAVNIPITDDDGNTENVWVIYLSRDGDEFTGSIANEPAVVKNITYGQEVTFSKDRIVDWHYTTDGKMRGSFTTCVILSREDPEKARKAKIAMGLTCDDGV